MNFGSYVGLFLIVLLCGFIFWQVTEFIKDIKLRKRSKGKDHDNKSDKDLLNNKKEINIK